MRFLQSYLELAAEIYFGPSGKFHLISIVVEIEISKSSFLFEDKAEVIPDR